MRNRARSLYKLCGMNEYAIHCDDFKVIVRVMVKYVVRTADEESAKTPWQLLCEFRCHFTLLSARRA